MRKRTLLLILFSVLLVQPSAHSGVDLKKTVAVFEFENDSGYSNWATIGHDFSDQLSDALLQSGRFIVLSRKDLDVVMAEQDLANSDRFAKSNAAAMGKLVSAQILVKGKIADFQENTSGSGQDIKVKGVRLGAKSKSTHIGVLVQLIDSTTGEILKSKRIDGKAKGGGLTLGYKGAIDVDTTSHDETPVGKAVQMAIDRAVDYIADALDDMPWSGKVVMVKDNVIYVNAGQNAGVKVGNEFDIYREGESLIDPDTGMNLGKERTKIGSVKVIEVQAKFAKATAEGFKSAQVAKGDLVLE